MARTTKQILREQEQQADRDRAQREAQAVATIELAAVPAVPDNRTARQRYLDSVAPGGIVGRLVKFSKEGHFTFADTGETVREDEDFVALCDQTLVSWVKFNDGEPPQRIGGLLYQNFDLPPREQLGDNREAEWPIGLSGRPEDPWKHEMLLVLRRPATLEMLTFATTSKTGRSGVGNLLKHYETLQFGSPGAYPVVRLKPGGYRDKRFGWVPTPSFIPVGIAGGLSPAVPDTSLKTQLDDEIPF
jgi:hypothetical protein